jgi:hypothetical protein
MLQNLSFRLLKTSYLFRYVNPRNVLEQALLGSRSLNECVATKSLGEA